MDARSITQQLVLKSIATLLIGTTDVAKYNESVPGDCSSVQALLKRETGLKLNII